MNNEHDATKHTPPTNRKRNAALIGGITVILVTGGIWLYSLMTVPTRIPQQTPSYTASEPTAWVEETLPPPVFNDEPPIVDITPQPMDKEAASILRYSNQLYVQEVRKLALTAQQQADSVNDTADNDVTPLHPTIQVTSPESAPEQSIGMTITDQLAINSIFIVGKRREAIVRLGNESIPVNVGSHFNGVTVRTITENSITFVENKTPIKRYLTQSHPQQTAVKEAE